MRHRTICTYSVSRIFFLITSKEHLVFIILNEYFTEHQWCLPSLISVEEHRGYHSKGDVSVYIITQAALLSNYTPLYNVRTNVVIMWNVLTTSPRYFSRRCLSFVISSRARIQSSVFSEQGSDGWVMDLSQQEIVHMAWNCSRPGGLSLPFSPNDQSSSSKSPKKHLRSVSHQPEPAEQMKQSMTFFLSTSKELQ